MLHFAGLYIVFSGFTSNGIFDKTASALNISMTACPIGIKCFNVGHTDKEIVTGRQGDNSIAWIHRAETYSVCYVDTEDIL